MVCRVRDRLATLRDNGFNVIVGQRQGKTYDKAVADGWVPGETLFSLEEAAEKVLSFVCCFLTQHRCNFGQQLNLISPQERLFISLMDSQSTGVTVPV